MFFKEKEYIHAFIRFTQIVYAFALHFFHIQTSQNGEEVSGSFPTFKGR